MATLPDIPTVDFATGADLIRVAMFANQTVLLIGDPGVGKSAIMYRAAKEMDMPLYVLLGSTLDPTDIGGLPMRSPDGTHLIRIPLEEIQRCSEKPGILFLDEISAAPGPVQAALLRLILERKAGSVSLHEETRVVAACNPPEQAPAGFELSAPLMGRMAVINFKPKDDEVIDFLRTLGSDDDSASPMDKAVRDEAMLFAAVANSMPELLQIEIPKSAINGGQPWASPRSCERMIRARAAATVAGIDPLSDAVFALTAGSMGERTAIAYSGVVRMITELPTIEEIVSDPEKCMCPVDKTKQVAALGLMPRLAQKNLWAAYIYASRLKPEFALAAHKALFPMAKYQPPLTDALTRQGTVARAKLSAMVGGPAKKQAAA
jgi:AAA domain (dynein-related subfamily)